MQTPTKYKMLADSSLEPEAKKGAHVYTCMKADYGCASDDTRITGQQHISVTLDPKGDYPFFTVREADLERIND